jgi:DNA-binding response OmpR family regulator
MQKLKILVVDDDYSILEFIKTCLGIEGFIVETAVNYLGAKEKIKNCIPDLILMDINMPDRDGISFSRELKLEAATEDIPVIIITASTDIQLKSDALLFGASDFIVKPFDVKDLKERIFKALIKKKGIAL